jgi:hypothetical protein
VGNQASVLVSTLSPTATMRNPEAGAVARLSRVPVYPPTSVKPVSQCSLFETALARISRHEEVLVVAEHRADYEAKAPAFPRLRRGETSIELKGETRSASLRSRLSTRCQGTSKAIDNQTPPFQRKWRPLSTTPSAVECVNGLVDKGAELAISADISADMTSILR